MVGAACAGLEAEFTPAGAELEAPEGEGSELGEMVGEESGSGAAVGVTAGTTLGSGGMGITGAGNAGDAVSIPGAAGASAGAPDDRVSVTITAITAPSSAMPPAKATAIRRLRRVGSTSAIVVPPSVCFG